MSRTSNNLEKALANAKSYEEWHAAALELDRLEKKDSWREDE